MTAMLIHIGMGIVIGSFIPGVCAKIKAALTSEGKAVETDIKNAVDGNPTGPPK